MYLTSIKHGVAMSYIANIFLLKKEMKDEEQKKPKILFQKNYESGAFT
jgi:hypothetical protein